MKFDAKKRKELREIARRLNEEKLAAERRERAAICHEVAKRALKELNRLGECGIIRPYPLGVDAVLDSTSFALLRKLFRRMGLKVSPNRIKNVLMDHTYYIRITV
jgi:hypothetical protein